MFQLQHNLFLLFCLLCIKFGHSKGETPLPSPSQDGASRESSISPLSEEYNTSVNQDPNNKLLVIVIDGLRWDSINTSHVIRGDQCTGDGGGGREGECEDPESFFTTMQGEAATAAWNSPVFPTTPTPNTNTIATGLLPASHGVLDTAGNTLVDANVTPIWKTALKHAKKTALLSWTSCETVPASPLLHCKDRVPLSGVENLLVQLTGDAALAAELLNTEQYSVVMMRTNLLYWASEHYGPQRKTVKSVMLEIEDVLNDLFSELRQYGQWKQLSVVLLSSNGQTATRPSKAKHISVSDCLSTIPTYRYFSAGSAILIPAQDQTAKLVSEELSNCNTMPDDAFTWHTMAELPTSNHWPGDSEELLLVATQGYALHESNANSMMNYSMFSADGNLQLAKIEELQTEKGKGRMAGDGYDVTNTDMNGIFIAKGPGFVKGVTGGPIVQTDVYQVLCTAAGFAPEPNNGLRSSVDWMIDNSAAQISHSSFAMILITYCITIFI